VEFLPQVNKPDNFLINAEIGLEASISKNSASGHLAGQLCQPTRARRKNNDVKLISSLVYKF